MTASSGDDKVDNFDLAYFFCAHMQVEDFFFHTHSYLCEIELIYNIASILERLRPPTHHGQLDAERDR